MREPLHIDATRGDVGRDQSAHFAAFEAFQRAFARILRLVAVNGGRRNPRAFQTLHHAIRAVLGTREHERIEHFGTLEQLDQQVDLLCLVDEEDFLHYTLGGRRRRSDADAHGVAQNAIEQARHFFGQSGREGQCLPLLRNLAEDLLDGGQEAHVQHAVCLIEYEHFEIIKVHEPFTHVIDQTPRGGDKDVNSS